MIGNMIAFVLLLLHVQAQAPCSMLAVLHGNSSMCQSIPDGSSCDISCDFGYMPDYAAPSPVCNNGVFSFTPSCPVVATVPLTCGYSWLAVDVSGLADGDYVNYRVSFPVATWVELDVCDTGVSYFDAPTVRFANGETPYESWEFCSGYGNIYYFLAPVGDTIFQMYGEPGQGPRTTFRVRCSGARTLSCGSATIAPTTVPAMGVLPYVLPYTEYSGQVLPYYYKFSTCGSVGFTQNTSYEYLNRDFSFDTGAMDQSGCYNVTIDLSTYDDLILLIKNTDSMDATIPFAGSCSGPPTCTTNDPYAISDCNIAPGYTCNLQCEFGYLSNNTVSYSCDPNANWFPAMPTCESMNTVPLTCGNIWSPVNVSGVPNGGYVYYRLSFADVTWVEVDVCESGMSYGAAPAIWFSNGMTPYEDWDFCPGSGNIYYFLAPAGDTIFRLYAEPGATYYTNFRVRCSGGYTLSCNAAVVVPNSNVPAMGVLPLVLPYPEFSGQTPYFYEFTTCGNPGFTQNTTYSYFSPDWTVRSGETNESGCFNVTIDLTAYTTDVVIKIDTGSMAASIPFAGHCRGLVCTTQDPHAMPGGNCITASGDTCDLQCEFGYMYNSTVGYSCNSSGDWVPATPTCEALNTVPLTCGNTWSLVDVSGLSDGEYVYYRVSFTEAAWVELDVCDTGVSYWAAPMVWFQNGANPYESWDSCPGSGNMYHFLAPRGDVIFRIYAEPGVARTAFRVRCSGGYTLDCSLNAIAPTPVPAMGILPFVLPYTEFQNAHLHYELTTCDFGGLTQNTTYMDFARDGSWSSSLMNESGCFNMTLDLSLYLGDLVIMIKTDSMAANIPFKGYCRGDSCTTNDPHAIPGGNCNTAIGDTCNLRCDYNFVSNDTVSYICDGSANWSPTMPTCEAVSLFPLTQCWNTWSSVMASQFSDGEYSYYSLNFNSATWIELDMCDSGMSYWDAPWVWLPNGETPYERWDFCPGLGNVYMFLVPAGYSMLRLYAEPGQAHTSFRVRCSEGLTLDCGENSVNPYFVPSMASYPVIIPYTQFAGTNRKYYDFTTCTMGGLTKNTSFSYFARDFSFMSPSMDESGCYNVTIDLTQLTADLVLKFVNTDTVSVNIPFDGYCRTVCSTNDPHALPGGDCEVVPYPYTPCDLRCELGYVYNNTNFYPICNNDGTWDVTPRCEALNTVPLTCGNTWSPVDVSGLLDGEYVYYRVSFSDATWVELEVCDSGVSYWQAPNVSFANEKTPYLSWDACPGSGNTYYFLAPAGDAIIRIYAEPGSAHTAFNVRCSGGYTLDCGLTSIAPTTVPAMGVLPFLLPYIYFAGTPQSYELTTCYGAGWTQNTTITYFSWDWSFTAQMNESGCYNVTIDLSTLHDDLVIKIDTDTMPVDLPFTGYCRALAHCETNDPYASSQCIADEGNYCSLQCSFPFFSNAGQVECMSDGSFSPDMPQCIQLSTCSAPPPQHGLSGCNEVYEGDTCLYFCQPGYKTNGVFATCQSNGTFDLPIECIPYNALNVTCGNTVDFSDNITFGAERVILNVIVTAHSVMRFEFCDLHGTQPGPNSAFEGTAMLSGWDSSFQPIQVSSSDWDSCLDGSVGFAVSSIELFPGRYSLEVAVATGAQPLPSYAQRCLPITVSGCGGSTPQVTGNYMTGVVLRIPSVTQDPPQQITVRTCPSAGSSPNPILLVSRHTVAGYTSEMADGYSSCGNYTFPGFPDGSWDFYVVNGGHTVGTTVAAVSCAPAPIDQSAVVLLPTSPPPLVF